MIEIKIHGRGGQGSVVAGKILAEAFFLENWFVQAFPEFGTERRGAPVSAFVRIARKQIFIKSNVYKPDYVIVLDPSLIKATQPQKGLKKGGWILINSPFSVEEYKFENCRVAVVDASKIATHFGLGSATSPIVNTAILGAFARVTGLFKLESLLKSIEDFAPVKKSENIEAAKQAFEEVLF